MKKLIKRNLEADIAKKPGYYNIMSISPFNPPASQRLVKGW